MKSKPIKRLGTISLRNLEANKILKELYLEKGITQCEIKGKGCRPEFALSWHHRKRRTEYKTVEELAEFKETVLTCGICHDENLRPNSDKSEEMFKRLRGDYEY